MKKTFLTILVLTAICLIGCGEANSAPPNIEATHIQASDNAISAEGTLLPGRTAELSFTQGGVVSEVLVKPGDKVTTGEALVRLVGFETIQAEITAAEFELISAQQAFDALTENAPVVTAQAQLLLANAAKALDDEEYRWRVQQKGNRASPETIREAEAKLKLAEDEVSHWQGIYNAASGDSAKAAALIQLTQAKRNRDSAIRSLNWYKGKPTDLDQAILDAKLSLAQAQLDDARRIWEQVKDGPNADDVEKAQALLELVKAQLTAAKAALDLYELRAPFDGELLSLDLSVGETAPPMTPVAFLADSNEWIVETKDLAEVDVAAVSVGDPATIKLDAFPNEDFKGKVTKINPVGKLYLGDMTYQITVTLDKPDPRFLWNMTAVVNVKTED
jgi:HlyD family secretion protein